MTKEQEEAIEKLEHYLKNSVYKKIDSDSSENIWELVNLEIPQAIEIVLNILKQNSAEIAEKSAEIEKYKYLYQKALDNTIEADRENIQLKKQIDLMATTLSAICTGLSTVRDHFEKEYCEFINSDKDCCWKTDTSCKDCIKQYFERKVRDERN